MSFEQNRPASFCNREQKQTHKNNTTTLSNSLHPMQQNLAHAWHNLHFLLRRECHLSDWTRSFHCKASLFFCRILCHPDRPWLSCALHSRYLAIVKHNSRAFGNNRWSCLLLVGVFRNILIVFFLFTSPKIPIQPSAHARTHTRMYSPTHSQFNVYSDIAAQDDQ